MRRPLDRRVRFFRVLLVFLATLSTALPAFNGSFGSGPSVAAASTLPTGFYEEAVATATAYQTTAFVFVPDGRILIAEKPGVIRVYKDGALLPTPLLDIRGRVNQYSDRGLLGLALDPDFATGSPYLYLTYTYEQLQDADPSNDNARKTAHISRFTVSGDTADPASEQVLVGKVTPPSGSCNDAPLADCLPSDGYSHSIGTLKFAPDGSLFATIGESADYNQVDDDALRAQNLDVLAGKVLRVNKDGTGWAGNPFANGNPNDNRSKVWAYGLRNPFRFNLRPGTAIPYLGDVGWGTWEEINVAPAGANLGWPCYEGDAQQPGYAPKTICQDLYKRGAGAVQAPLVQWLHENYGSAAATGGAFYVGTSYPAQYQGAYFYGDYAQGFLRTLRVDDNQRLVPGSVADFATNVSAPVDIEMGPDGDLYYLSIETGTLYRLRYGTPPPPPATTTGYLSAQKWVSATNGYGPVELDRSNGENAAGDGNPLRIGGITYARGLGMNAPADVRYALGTGCDTFTAQVGIDDEVSTTSGSVVFQVWSGETKLFDSGVRTGADPALPVRVDMTGRTELRLVVTDAGDGPSSDHADWAEARCDTNAPPVVTISAPQDGGVYRIGDTIAYSGSAVDPDGGPAPTLAWQLIARHCPNGVCHAHPATLPGASGTFVVSDHDDDTHLELLLTATDSSGATAAKTVRLDPQQATLTLATTPTGLGVIYGGKALAPTATQRIDIGGTRTITAPTPQTLGGVSYVFARWSDGDTRAQRSVTMRAGGLDLTAIFAPVGSSPSPSPSPSPIVRYSVTANVTGSGMVSPSGMTVYDAGTTATYSASPVGDVVFLGWTLDGSAAGYAPTITLTAGVDHTLMATFVPRQTFGDATPGRTGATEAIAQLAARGIIKGCDPAAGLFCPTDPTLRAQMAVLIVRAMGWGAENPANPFPDRNGVDDELWRAVAILANQRVAKGYSDGTYGTTSPVLNAQVIAFITRAMVARGYWAFQLDDSSVYPNVAASSGHRVDLVTYVHYAGLVRGTTSATGNFNGWDQPASRAYFAFALWQALDSYFGVDRPGLGGYIP